MEFRKFGEVSFVNIVRNRTTKVSAGFGFVDMPKQEEAEAAIAMLHGKDLKGQILNVNTARPRSL